tara:strand:+ start:2162 stop:3415 length:1254 start_codon:yes stop_codon:yes gene_type:complete
MIFKNISVIGLGYIGLPTAALFSNKKIHVLGVDINKSVVEKINGGSTHIVEPELDKIVNDSVKNGYLKAAIHPKESDAYIIAVPTPFKTNNSQIPEPDLSFVISALNSFAAFLKKGDLIVLESTSPVGTTEIISNHLNQKRSDLTFPHNSDNPDINIAYCPERVLPGNIVKEIIKNDRVIGGLTEKCTKKAIELYSNFVEGEMLETDSRTAEMVKLTENSCRDVQIAFANELSIICDELDINVWNLISLANKHPRINILQPGPGVGGHCIAVDPWFIVNKTPSNAKLISMAREVNDSKPNWVIAKVKDSILEITKSLKKETKDITIACLGLSFKANIDDIRESPALYITREISKFHDGEIIAVEPNIKKIQGERFKLESLECAKKKADIILLLVDHDEFKKIESPNAYKIIDTRGVW